MRNAANAGSDLCSRWLQKVGQHVNLHYGNNLLASKNYFINLFLVALKGISTCCHLTLEAIPHPIVSLASLPASPLTFPLASP
jgi:hypothetical protein